MSKNNEFYVVGIYEEAYQAHIVKSLLASYDIEAEVINEETTQIYPMPLSGNFYVKLISNIENKDRIEKILSSSFEEEE